MLLLLRPDHLGLDATSPWKTRFVRVCHPTAAAEHLAAVDHIVNATPLGEFAGKSPVLGKRKHSELVKMAPEKLAAEILHLNEQLKNQTRKLDEVASAVPGAEFAVVITQKYEELKATVEKVLTHVQNTYRVIRREAKLAAKERAENRDMREVLKRAPEFAEKEAGKMAAEKEAGKKATDKETVKRAADKETGKRVADKEAGKCESSSGGKQQKGVAMPLASPLRPLRDSVAATYGPVAATCGPVAVTCSPVAATCGPVAAIYGPVAVTCGPVAATCGPVAATCGPVAAPCGPVVATYGHAPATCGPAATCGLVAATCSPNAVTCGPVALP
ncbi:unnamed protein product [Closterium sp. NIES-65]|nr:unnamed protein product [Closterium sp. NIES-65]